jgi:hypothetical protein
LSESVELTLYVGSGGGRRFALAVVNVINVGLRVSFARTEPAYLELSQASVISSSALLRLIARSEAGSLQLGQTLLASNHDRIHC